MSAALDRGGVGIVGCGLVGRKRADALAGSRLVVTSDIDPERARSLAAQFPRCESTTNWSDVIGRQDVDVVIVATTHEALAGIALAAVRAGKHVLLEKPGARRPAELAPIREAARASGVVVKVGFNHRLHPAVRQSRELVASGSFGPVMYVRARYGHGGRPGYEHEWRANPARSGGGELLDQGVHLIDLARCFIGDIESTSAHLGRFFWPMAVEDNAFMLLRASGNRAAWLHASWTEWKNLFCFEIFCRDAKLQIDGLGGSYGVERLTLYKMLPRMGPPEITTWEFPGADTSWEHEFAQLLAATRGEPTTSADLADAIAALTVVEQAYAEDAAR